VNRKWKNWYQNEVYEEKNGADSRDKLKHNGRSEGVVLLELLSVMKCYWTKQP